MNTSIICRMDASRRPVVFLLDTINQEAKTVDLWRGKSKDTETVDIDYYKNTKNLSERDEQELVSKFADTFGETGIVLRRRMFRTDKSADTTISTVAKIAGNIETQPEHAKPTEPTATVKNTERKEPHQHTDKKSAKALEAAHREFKERLILNIENALKEGMNGMLATISQAIRETV